MATATTHNPLPPLLLLLLLLITTTTTAAASGSSSETGELWCVAKNNAEDAALQAALDWACGPGGADCRPIQPGGACYEPDDIQSLASFAFNDYFLRSPRPDASACDFSGTAALTSLNPGHGSCIFPSSSSARNGNFTGRSEGLGPSSADLSGGLQIKISPWPSSIALFVLLIATNIWDEPNETTSNCYG
ncbi:PLASMODESMATA CALLOSE-BINDING PROTEIN 5-like [Ananas comosus]|uniref:PLASMODESMATA CALLOSE-BINDING PROTEIN 5-like n=1 Tax=Ananas comosus TaxID=4615 RepID=A0A6P5F3M1_ANACO|nr:PLASMODESMATA CALLOSE-BINDING PROTEIN 5-like [Ananas comosus]